jgi:hypothetical protein
MLTWQLNNNRSLTLIFVSGYLGKEEQKQSVLCYAIVAMMMSHLLSYYTIVAMMMSPYHTNQFNTIYLISE